LVNPETHATTFAPNKITNHRFILLVLGQHLPTPSILIVTILLRASQLETTHREIMLEMLQETIQGTMRLEIIRVMILVHLVTIDATIHQKSIPCLDFPSSLAPIRFQSADPVDGPRPFQPFQRAQSFPNPSNPSTDGTNQDDVIQRGTNQDDVILKHDQYLKLEETPFARMHNHLATLEAFTLQTCRVMLSTR